MSSTNEGRHALCDHIFIVLGPISDARLPCSQELQIEEKNYFLVQQIIPWFQNSGALETRGEILTVNLWEEFL